MHDLAIKLKLEGFNELLKEIEKAGEKIEPVTKNVLEQSANIMQEELKSQMQKSDVPKNLINEMPPPTVEEDSGLFTAHVGYKKGTYNPHNLSNGYKVVFLNYGTPYRKKHGKIKDVSEGGKIKLGFITRAKNKAKKKITTQQENALKEILKGLK